MSSPKKQILVAIADDHTLLRKALAKLVNSFEEYNILFEADNGMEIKKKINEHLVPDLVLLDVNMPRMDGFETAAWLNKNYPKIKVLALSMFSDERTIIRMLRKGARGYILKNIEPEELKKALDSVMKKDFYLSEDISGKIISGLHKDIDRVEDSPSLTQREKEFLSLICSEITYKEIAAKMFVSPRTVDEYRNSLFEKLKVKSRVGLVMYAIRNGLAEA
ncbi:MAG TPA: DNA-binding response regulator [Chitinophagaceae bacterium]|jgi:two-component system, NarL family, invasion response regulator UvrY|nr:DNA-binding response regulator [Chitinophagaceae bacterium]